MKILGECDWLWDQNCIQVYNNLKRPTYRSEISGAGIVSRLQDPLQLWECLYRGDSQKAIQGFSGPLSQKSDEKRRMRAFWREF